MATYYRQYVSSVFSTSDGIWETYALGLSFLDEKQYALAWFEWNTRIKKWEEIDDNNPGIIGIGWMGLYQDLWESVRDGRLQLSSPLEILVLEGIPELRSDNSVGPQLPTPNPFIDLDVMNLNDRP